MALKIVSGIDVTSISLSSYLDLAKNELRNAQIQNLSTTQIAAISSPVQGQLVYDSTVDSLKVYDGSAWAIVGASPDDTTIELSSSTLSIKSGGVGTTQLAAGAVTTAKLAADAVTGAKIADDTIDSEHYAAGSIDTEHLAADAVTGAKIADDAIDSEHYTDGSIDTAHLANDAVTGDKLAALTVATGNIAASAVTSAKISDGAVGTAKLADGGISTVKIGDSQITTAKIATDAVTAAKIADNSVDIARLNVTDGSAGQFLKTDGSGNLSFASDNNDDVTPGNLALRLSELDTTHTQNVDSTDVLKIGSSTDTPDVQVLGDLTVDGDLTVSGTTTTVNSTTVTVDDPIFTLGGDTAPTEDDNKDRGIEFNYHNGTSAKVGFFGWDDSARKFVFISDATNTSEVFSGSYGDAQFGSVEAGTVDAATTFKIGGTIVDSSAGELNILNGATVTTSELNILDGVTATTAELNILDGVTATASELNLLDGVTATTTELNYVDGVTSAIQTQLNGKEATITGAATTITSSNLTASRVVVSNGSGKVAASAVTSTELGVLDGITATTAELNKLDGVTMSTAQINSITSRAGRYVHTETDHGGGELVIASSTHGLTFPFHVTVIDNNGNQLLANIVQNASTEAITIEDLPAETIKVHITGGLS